jgi:hypothetical protein
LNSTNEIQDRQRNREIFDNLEKRLFDQLDQGRRQRLEQSIDPQEEAHELLEQGILE